jgi:hypothetical protein
MKTLYFDKGMFDEYIDMAYVLTMENSTREADYLYQLNKYKPLSKVIIQYNKGYKLCKKNIFEQTSMADINHAYLNVFLDAKKKKYSNILIFEDDFIFDDISQDSYKKHISRIGNFITNNKYHVYNLGPCGSINIPSIINIRLLFMAMAHACIYSSLYIDYYIENYKNMKLTYDIYWNNVCIIKYQYYIPICFQKHSIYTQNTQELYSKYFKNEKIKKFFLNLANLFTIYTKIDTYPSKAYKSIYIVSYIFSYLLLFFIIFIIYYIFLYLNK